MTAYVPELPETGNQADAYDFGVEACMHDIEDEFEQFGIPLDLN